MQRISFLFTRMAKIDINAVKMLENHNETVLCKCTYCEQNGKHRLDYEADLSQSLEVRKQDFILEEFVSSLLELFDLVEQHTWNFSNIEVRLRHIFKMSEGYQFIYIPTVKTKHTSKKKIALNLLKQLKSEDTRIPGMLHTLKHLVSEQDIVLFLNDFAIKETPAIASESDCGTTILSQEESECETSILSQSEPEEGTELLMQVEDSEGETSILSEHTTAFIQNDSAECETTFLSDQVSMPVKTGGQAEGECELYLLRVGTGECIHINKESYSIGKDIHNMDYVLGNESVSRNHATIYCEKGSYYLSDNGSTNGTTIEGIRVKAGEKVEMGDGDILSLGNEVFQVLLERR